MMQYAIKCDKCKGGYKEGMLCLQCGGNGSILVDEKKSWVPRLLAWAALVTLLAIIARFIIW